MRIAVALELVAGKVWALLDAVQPLVGSTAAMARVHPEWVRRHGLARLAAPGRRKFRLSHGLQPSSEQSQTVMPRNPVCEQIGTRILSARGRGLACDRAV